MLTAGLAAACGGDDSATEPGTTVSTGAGAAPTSEWTDARCEQNKAAGTITFLTSFDYAAAASIIDVVAAEDQGYFKALCLDVKLQPGFSTANVAAVSAGTAQMTSLGSFSEVAVANSKDAELVAVAVEGHTSIEELLVENSANITELKQLEGKSIGIKGAIPFSLRALLASEGVDEAKITQIEVDFNPVVLFETPIVGLPVYKSNEPGQLDAQGYGGKYTSFDPRESEIPASFAVFTTSRGFAAEHPTAVADFLRAALKGFEYATANPAEAVAASLKRTDKNLFLRLEGETFRWDTERELVISSTPRGAAVGTIDQAALQAELDALIELGVVEAGSVDVATSVNDAFMNDIVDNGKLIWFN
ncbi:MAG: ABC transporter substrate-binding protein [Acidimicrobiales bacterium]